MKCKTGKRRYRDRVGAMIALASTQRAKSSDREEKRVYRCGHCFGWHLTSKAITTTTKGEK